MASGKRRASDGGDEALPIKRARRSEAISEDSGHRSEPEELEEPFDALDLYYHPEKYHMVKRRPQAKQPRYTDDGDSVHDSDSSVSSNDSNSKLLRKLARRLKKSTGKGDEKLLAEVSARLAGGKNDEEIVARAERIKRSSDYETPRKKKWRLEDEAERREVRDLVRWGGQEDIHGLRNDSPELTRKLAEIEERECAERREQAALREEQEKEERAAAEARGENWDLC